MNQSYQLLALESLCDAAKNIVSTRTFPSRTVCDKLETALRYLADSIQDTGRAFADARSRGHMAANQLRDALES